ncbi:hypothetical protein [Sphingomonas sp. PP-CC-3G-468]|uniref:hypothetical protein n=1 Tax=Sphingomonas sp. PP-CC-3G-468 TaxID=2135656 RepID=UPI00104A494D|nr:hypothetical protein [Sphingomonas sp. PP-CC-3G-468]TCM07463.1 hypothetical protein C8J41_103371 [Sphingomonas sp. PP-CC-3G-468]
MASPVRMRRLDLAAETPESARIAIRSLLESEPAGTRKVYAALAHKVWSLMVERRLDAEIRDWHVLLENVRAFIRPKDEAGAERITALADLVRESISFANANPVPDIARRPVARSILDLLLGHEGPIPRMDLLAASGIKTSHLTNVLTQLAARGLIDRIDRGKNVEVALTPLGRQVARGEDPAATAPVQEKTVYDRIRLEKMHVRATDPICRIAVTHPQRPANDAVRMFDDPLRWVFNQDGLILGAGVIGADTPHAPRMVSYTRSVPLLQTAAS